MGRRAIDMTDQKVGMMQVLRIDDSVSGSGKHRRWICKCECGNIKSISGTALREGQISCGCLISTLKTTHGGCGTRLYSVWRAMLDRCKNQKIKTYELYGGRGISVCKEWSESFETFRKWAIESGYNEDAPRGKTTIDRIDVNGNYEPSNCRICDQKTQGRNTRKNVRIKIGDRELTAGEWAEVSGVKESLVRDRYIHGVRGEMLIFAGSLHGMKANYH